MLAPKKRVPLSLKLTDETGGACTLKDFLGTWVVLYFYPKDLTPGCTLEAEAFRDTAAAFKRLGARVIGVSKDTCRSHQRFIEKKDLNFTLIADETHALMEAFGTWGERKFMGRTYMGTSRSTFLIDPEGKVVHVWEQVKPAGHAEEVLSVLKTLRAERSTP